MEVSGIAKNQLKLFNLNNKVQEFKQVKTNLLKELPSGSKIKGKLKGVHIDFLA